MSQIPHHTVKCRYVLQEDVKAEPDAHPEGGPVILTGSYKKTNKNKNSAKHLTLMTPE